MLFRQHVMNVGSVSCSLGRIIKAVFETETEEWICAFISCTGSAVFVRMHDVFENLMLSFTAQLYTLNIEYGIISEEHIRQ